MHTVYDWLSARGDRAARHGRKNRCQREWPAMSGDTVNCGQQLAHGGQPEAFRLRGELQTKQGRREAAEADFRTALTLARSIGAKAYELRAAMSLARLLRDSGRCDEAHSILTEIYNWFTKGFDTRDLKDAKAQLDELSA